MKDDVFLDPAKRKSDFSFNKETADVFDDMLERSVPFYFETQNMMLDIVSEFLIDKTNIYDLGCSTGTTIEMIKKNITGREYGIVGVDSSQSMLDKTSEKLKNNIENFKLVLGDLNDEIILDNPSIVIMNLTLQFVRPPYRDRLIRNIYKSLHNQGAFILIEKVLCENSRLNRGFISFYHKFKTRNKYTEMEISSKRESLENVLIPYRNEENVTLLKNNGFQAVETFFRWFNFTGIVAIKNEI